MHQRLLIDYGMVNQRLNLFMIFRLTLSKKRLKINTLTTEILLTDYPRCLKIIKILLCMTPTIKNVKVDYQPVFRRQRRQC